jgi:uncharacterized protein (TIGR02453 family)
MGAFSGFGAEGLKFLRALAFHQEKAWYEANKDTYIAQLRDPMAALVTDVAAALAKKRIPLTGDAKGSLFRINRDVRFSKDKSPYKTHVGAVLTPTGRKQDMRRGVLYLHVDPTGSFMAAGFYMPEPPDLLACRRAIVAQPRSFATLEKKLAAGSLELGREGAMKRLPRGFEDHAALAPALLLKSFITRREVADRDLRAAKLVDQVVQFAADARPLLDWGTRAIEAHRV